MKFKLFLIGLYMHFGILEISAQNEFPWRPIGNVNPPGVLGLHTEIQQFYEYMQLTPIERALREKVIARIESLVAQIWPNAKAKVIGSFSYGLTLPTSDIDIMILGVSDRRPLQLLASKILHSGIAEPNSMLVRDNLRIPIIEFIDRESKINIDIPFHNEPTLQVAALLREYTQKYPVFVKLILVLKQFISQRDLNNVFTGGISSYALCLMCINFLEMHPETKANEDVNVGALLLDFLELYGRKFDYQNTGIVIRNGGIALPRKELPCGLIDGNFTLFCIRDAVNPGINACSVSYRAPDVKEAFYAAFNILSSAIQNNNNHTILGGIVHVTDDFLEYRNWIRDNFELSSLIPESGVIEYLSSNSTANNSSQMNLNKCTILIVLATSVAWIVI